MVGYEAVAAVVAVGVGDDDLPTVLGARRRPVPHRRPVDEAPLSVREVDPDRECLMRDRICDARNDKVVEPVAVQVTGLDLGETPDVRLRGNGSRRPEPWCPARPG